MAETDEKAVLPVPVNKVIGLGETVAARRRGANRPHKGLDIYVPVGTPVYSVLAGRVMRVVFGDEQSKLSQQKAGPFVDVMGPDPPWIYRYLHLDRNVVVAAKQDVRRGEIIGYVGPRGSSGIKHAKPHLHFEKRQGDYEANREKWNAPGKGDYGRPVDPLTFLPRVPQETARMDFDDINWKAILDVAIDVGGPILATAVDAEAPGAGTVIRAGLPLVKKFVVDEYVPDGTSKVSVNAQTLPPDKSHPDAKVAATVLTKAGWSDQAVDDHLVGPRPAQSEYRVDTAQGALLVHRVLNEAGWSTDQAVAILNGPYAFHESRRPRVSPPSIEVQRAMASREAGAMQQRLTAETEHGGYTPINYHGTMDAHQNGLGNISERPEDVASAGKDL